MLTLHEAHQLIRADVIVSYLKATVEKTLSLLGAIFGVTDLADKKTHRARLALLKERVPQRALSTCYAERLLEMVTSESLAALNNLRSGLLHKRGVARLQPHSYAGIDPLKLPDLEIFAELRAQHARNTGALLATLATLTDDLVRRDQPQDPNALRHELAALRAGLHPLIG